MPVNFGFIKASSRLKRRKRKEGTFLKGKGFRVCVDADLLFALLIFTGRTVSQVPASPSVVLPPSREGVPGSERELDWKMGFLFSHSF